MKVVQLNSNWYVKTLGKDMQLLIARLYDEVRQRKEKDERHEMRLQSVEEKTNTTRSQLDILFLHFQDVASRLKSMFPINEPIAYFDRAVIIKGKLKVDSIIISSNQLPIELPTNQLIPNLNAEYFDGKKISQVYSEILTSANNTMNERVNYEKSFLLSEINSLRSYVDKKFVPLAHVGARGSGVHGNATYEEDGFMSAQDKQDHDAMKQKLSTFDLPGGINIGYFAPSSPKAMQVWIDLN